MIHRPLKIHQDLLSEQEHVQFAYKHGRREVDRASNKFYGSESENSASSLFGPVKRP